MRVWFPILSWAHVVKANEKICDKGNAQHGISESQSPKFIKLWEDKAKKPLTFWDMIQLCKKMHEGAPFFNFNGNTFASIAVEVSRQIKHPEQFLLEDAIVNAIADNLSAIQEKNLRGVSDSLEKFDPPLEI